MIPVEPLIFKRTIGKFMIPIKYIFLVLLLIGGCQLEKQNPADSKQLLPMLHRQKAIYNFFPKKIAADGGYASKDNLSAAKSPEFEPIMT